MHFKKIITIFIFTAFLSLFITSCGSNSDDNGILNPERILQVGFFLDSEVKGLNFQSGDNSPGVTDEFGTFKYAPGQALSFSIGGVELGTLSDGARIITPKDYAVPENVARFIQTLDYDSDPSNGIDISVYADMLSGHTVSSDVFEHRNSTDFENDPAIIEILNLLGLSLIDAASANDHLADGTDNTFDLHEIAGSFFIVKDPLESGISILVFDELLNETDRGSTGYNIWEDGLTSAGEEGWAEYFTWILNPNGTMTLNFPEDETVTVHRSGGSSHSLSIIAETNSGTELISLIRPGAVTETDICGAPVTQNGDLKRDYTISGNGGSEHMIFNSDGALTCTNTEGGSLIGFWEVDDRAPNVIRIMTGTDPYIIPNQWNLIVLLDGDFNSGGQILMMDVSFQGFHEITGSPRFIWQEFKFRTITPM
jgi:hypothetical protein